MQRMGSIRASGFTMMEIMITMVILAILVGLAVPSYRTTVESGRANEAITNLSVIHMGQKIYHNENDAYWDPADPVAVGGVGGINDVLSVDITAKYYDDITIDADNSVSGAHTYTATLTRNAVDGGGSSKWYQFDYTQGGAAPVETSGGAF